MYNNIVKSLSINDFKEVVLNDDKLFKQLFELITKRIKQYNLDKKIILGNNIQLKLTTNNNETKLSCNNYNQLLTNIVVASKKFGCSDKLRRNINVCYFVRNTSKFNEYVEKLLLTYIKEDILPNITFLKKCELSHKRGIITDDMIPYLLDFQNEMKYQ